MKVWKLMVVGSNWDRGDFFYKIYGRVVGTKSSEATGSGSNPDIRYILYILNLKLYQKPNCFHPKIFPGITFIQFTKPKGSGFVSLLKL